VSSVCPPLRGVRGEGASEISSDLAALLPPGFVIAEYIGTEVSIDCGRSCGTSSDGTQIGMLRACRGVRRIKRRRIRPL
jgi:hypothetical protein